MSFALFKYYPILLGFFVSLFEVNIVDLPGTFIGFDNYIRAFQDKDFLNAIVNTFQFLVISLLINFWVPILLATLINEVRRGKTFVRTMYFIPAVAPGIAMSVLWKYIWQPDYGLANYLMKVLGLPTQRWLNDPVLVKWCMQFPGLIIGGGLTMVIYLAALQDVPRTLYEAAEIDGANALKRFFYITLPGISPAIFFQLIMGIINNFQYFTQAYLMIGSSTGGGLNVVSGGAENSLLFYALYLYQNAFNLFKMGKASAMAWILFVVVAVVTAVVFKTQDRWVSYGEE